MANSWLAGHGRFERRISFARDAQLGSVWSEFTTSTGVLTVVVPRRRALV